MKNILISAFLITTASPAFALSCMPPNPIRSTIETRDSEDAYVMAYGRVEIEGERPERAEPIEGQEQLPLSYTARFTGYSTSATGIDLPVVLDIDVEETCLASWCGEAALDTEMLIFLKQTDELFLLSVGPCDAGGGFPDLDTDLLGVIYDCAFNDTCDDSVFE